MNSVYFSRSLLTFLEGSSTRRGSVVKQVDSDSMIGDLDMVLPRSSISLICAVEKINRVRT